jgi:histone-binding protein RBBP4
VQIPKRTNASGAEKLDRADYDDERGELGGHTIPPAPRIQIIQKINHAGEVNRARYMPQNPDLIATKAVTGEVLVFDRTKHSSEPERGGVCKPDIRLVGQTREGCVVLLISYDESHSGSGMKVWTSVESPESRECTWSLRGHDCLPLVSRVSYHRARSKQNATTRDINSYTKAKTSIEPTNVFRGHTSVVGVGLAHFVLSYLTYRDRMSTGIQQKRMSLPVWGTTKCS